MLTYTFLNLDLLERKPLILTMIELLIFYKGESLIFSPNGKESGMNRNRHHMWTQLIIKRNLTAAEITCNQMSS